MAALLEASGSFRMKGVRIGAATALVALSTACSASPASTDTACDGPAPARADCLAEGLFWVDCGGDGAPVFACAVDGGWCRWFVGGCVASGWRPTDCDASDPCCASQFGGTWPYADSFQPSVGTGNGELVEDVAAAGSMPIGRDRAGNLDVSIDPARVFPPAALTCETPGPAFLCGSASVSMPSVSIDGDEVLVRTIGHAGVFTTTLSLALPSAGALRARAFYRVGPDFSSPMPICEHASTPLGVVTGSVVLSGPPTSAELHGDATLTLPDESRVRITF